MRVWGRGLAQVRVLAKVQAQALARVRVPAQKRVRALQPGPVWVLVSVRGRILPLA